MEEILIVFALIIVVTLLFWLDKKAEVETSEAGGINEILQVFNRVRWGMNSSELKKIFSEKQFSHKEESDDLAGVGYTDRIEDHEALVSFYFLKPDKESSVGIYFRILNIPIDKSNFLFSKLCERYGFPLNQNNAEGKSVLWDLENSVLTFEVSDSQELQIRFWDKGFYTNNIELTHRS